MRSSSSSRTVFRTADGTVRVFLAEALLLPTGLITAAYLTRHLGPEGYGLFTLAAMLVTWVAQSTAALFSRTTIKFVSEAEDWRPVGTTVLRLHLACGLGAALLLWLAASPVSALFGAPKLSTYLQLFTFELLLFNLVQAHRGILIGRGLFRKRALASAIRWPARLLLIIALVEAGLSVSGAILGSIGATLIELAVCRVYVRPSLISRSSFPVRRLWSYATPLLLYALCVRLFGKIDLFALAALGGTAAEAGFYGAAQNLTVVPSLFALAFSPLLLSTLGRLLQEGHDQAARTLSRNAMRLVLGMLPFAGMAAGAAHEIVVFIFGADFALTASLLAPLIFSAVALVMISVATVVLVAAGRPGWTVALTGPLLVLAVAGHALLIPRLGPLGAALVTTTLAGAGALAAVAVVYVRWRVAPPTGTVVRSLLLCGGAYAAAALWPAPGAWVALKLLALLVAIPAGFWLLGEFSADERAFLRALIPFRS